MRIESFLKTDKWVWKNKGALVSPCEYPL